MKTCSYCGKENEDGAMTCRECGTEKFRSAEPSKPPSLPEKPAGFIPRTLTQEERQQAFVTLRSCRTIEEADALATQLKAEGIDAFLPDEALMVAVGWNVNTYGYVRVKVPTEQYDKAAEFLVASEETAIPPSYAESELARLNVELPLTNGMRLLLFLLPAGACPLLFMGVMIRAYYINRGYKRRGDEASAALVLGLIFWLLVYAVVSSRPTG